MALCLTPRYKEYVTNTSVDSFLSLDMNCFLKDFSGIISSNMNKALIVALAVGFFLFNGLFFTPSVKAQSFCPDPYDKACVDSKKSPPEVKERNKGVKAAEKGNGNLDSYVDTWTGSFLAKSVCILGGEQAACEPSVAEKKAGVLVGSGIMGSTVALISNMYRYPPADTATYLASVKNDLRLGSPAYAQGLGFSALTPILSIWTTMRNVAYFFFVVAFIVIGFMIMFRQKISGQAVVTAQQAIPSIIIALLTVTFSYAIAGLLIDGMYLIMFLIGGLFGKTELISGNVFQIAGNLIGGNAAVAGADAIARVVNASLGEGLVGSIGSFITNIGATVIILLVIVFNTFRLFFALLKVYIEIIINIAFSPVILMMGAIPGQNPFGKWVKDLVGNLAVFPMILIILIMYDVIRAAAEGTNGGFLPPYVTGYTAADALPLLAGTALILALPNAVEETKKAFGVSQGGLFGTLFQAGLKNAESGVQFAPPTVLGGLSLPQSVIQGVNDSRLTGGNVFSSVYARGKSNLGTQIKVGNQWARRIANVREGRTFDPNSWENALLNLQREKDGPSKDANAVRRDKAELNS